MRGNEGGLINRGGKLRALSHLWFWHDPLTVLKLLPSVSTFVDICCPVLNCALPTFPFVVVVRWQTAPVIPSCSEKAQPLNQTTVEVWACQWDRWPLWRVNCGKRKAHLQVAISEKCADCLMVQNCLLKERWFSQNNSTSWDALRKDFI